LRVESAENEKEGGEVKAENRKAKSVRSAKAECRKAKGERMAQPTRAKVADVEMAMEERLRGQEDAELWVVDTRLGKILVGVAGERVWLGLSGRWLEPLRTRKFTIGPNGEGLEQVK
jgi:hypothetical protein